MNQKELISGCIRGDRQCQVELFKQFSGKLLGVCIRYTRHRIEAEDILQDAFIKIFKNLEKYEGKGSFEGWLKRIAVNCSLAFAKKVHPVYFVDETPDSSLQMSEVPDAYSNLGKEEIMNLLKRLPESLYVVFNLVVIEGYNHREVGEMLGITEGNSRGSLSRARSKLIEILQSENSVGLDVKKNFNTKVSALN